MPRLPRCMCLNQITGSNLFLCLYRQQKFRVHNCVIEFQRCVYSKTHHRLEEENSNDISQLSLNIAQQEQRFNKPQCNTKGAHYAFVCRGLHDEIMIGIKKLVVTDVHNVGKGKEQKYVS